MKCSIRSLLWVSISVLPLLGGCATMRNGHTPSIGDCDYCVVREDEAHGYAEMARSILSQSFVVLDEYDPRLRSPAVRDRTCALTLRWQRGFLYTPVWADVTDFASGEVVMRTEVNGPGMWSGVSAAVPLALQDVVAARRAAGPLYLGNPREPMVQDAPLPDRAPAPAYAEPAAPARSKSERLRELRELYDDGLISEGEYQEQRGDIIRSPY